jgi:hypothetical protein
MTHPDDDFDLSYTAGPHLDLPLESGMSIRLTSQPPDDRPQDKPAADIFWIHFSDGYALYRHETTSAHDAEHGILIRRESSSSTGYGRAKLTILGQFVTDQLLSLGAGEIWSNDPNRYLRLRLQPNSHASLKPAKRSLMASVQRYLRSTYSGSYCTVTIDEADQS